MRASLMPQAKPSQKPYHKLPRLIPPAGYVFMLEDVEYGMRFQIGWTSDPRNDIKRLQDEFPFETRLAHLERSEDARKQARELQERDDPGGRLGEWFDRETPAETLAPPAPTTSVSLRDLALAGTKQEAPSAPPPVIRRRVAAAESGQSRRPQRVRARIIALLIIAVMLIGALDQAFDLRAVFDASRRALTPRETSARFVTATPYRRSEVPPVALQDASPTPGATQLSTSTAAPPTATHTAVPPTATHTAVPPTATHTALPPTATHTALPPTATHTAMPPTATHTTVPPTATHTALPPTATHTALPPTATNAVVPSATALPRFVARQRANVRDCADTRCSIVAILKAGEVIEAIAIVEGSEVYGSAEWIEFAAGESRGFAHRGAFSLPAPARDYIVVTLDDAHAMARACPRLACLVLDRLPAGTSIEGSEVVGEAVNGSVRWVQFERDAGAAYVHASLLRPSA